MNSSPDVEFARIIETEVLTGIEKAFHAVVAYDPNPATSKERCKRCAGYLKARLDGYVDVMADLIGQAKSYASYGDYDRFIND